MSDLASVIQFLYGLLAFDALMIALPALVIWYRLRRTPDFKYFALRAYLTAIAHVVEALSLVVLILFHNLSAIWIVLGVWEIGEILKVVGEWLVVAYIEGAINGIHPAAPRLRRPRPWDTWHWPWQPKPKTPTPQGGEVPASTPTGEGPPAPEPPAGPGPG